MISGWSARLRKLAGYAGAIAVPMVLAVAAFYPPSWHFGLGMTADPAFLASLALCPLCWVVGKAAASIRRALEQVALRQDLRTARR